MLTMAVSSLRVSGGAVGFSPGLKNVALALSDSVCVSFSGYRSVIGCRAENVWVGSPVDRKNRQLGRKRVLRSNVVRAVVEAATAPAPSAERQVRPSPAETARTIVDICTEGTLSTLSEKDSWPTATAVRFALDSDGNPVFRFPSTALHTRNVAFDNRASLHVQLEQPGRQKPQCTLQGRINKVEDMGKRKKLETDWERRFGLERAQDDDYFIMMVDQARQAQDMGEEEVWMSGVDYSSAVADPLREFAPKIVEDMNRKHWEDVRRFINVYAGLKDVEVEEVSMTWIDRLGFDLHVLTRSREMLEIRVPFTREVTDDRDARSSLTIMAQIAWERERSFNPPEVAFVGSFSVSS